MNMFRVTFLVLVLFTYSSSSLTVRGIIGEGAVVNNSHPLVVMDCHYDINPGEEAGLTVTWYRNRDLRPVYQWIPGSQPQALGLLKDRLDLKYQSSPDALRQYTALAFIAPTTELAGDYTCKVGTYYAEGSATGKFMVYTPPSEFDMRVSSYIPGMVTVDCSALKTYPEPEITIFKIDVWSNRRSLMATRYQKDYSANSNLFSLRAEASIPEGQVIGKTKFECLLSIPDTEYRLEESFLYYSEGRAYYSESGKIQPKWNIYFITLLSFLMIFKLNS